MPKKEDMPRSKTAKKTTTKKTATKKNTRKVKPLRSNNASQLSQALASASGGGTPKASTGVMAELSLWQLNKLFLVWLLVQSAVLYLASWLFPAQIVLGTSSISAFEAVVYSMFVLTLIVVGALPILELFQRQRGRLFGTMDWALIYFFITTASLWLIGRFAVQLGLGLSSWMVAVGLGLALSLTQGVMAVRLGK